MHHPGAIITEELRLPENEEGDVKVDAGYAKLHGNLCIPAGAGAVVLFIHGSGRRRSEHNEVARLCVNWFTRHLAESKQDQPHQHKAA